MIALDTNILARFYVDDPGDSEAVKQRPIAYAIITKLPNLFVPLTVILELEWVLRAFTDSTPRRSSGSWGTCWGFRT